MNSTELINAFRCDTVDDVEPYLWSTAEVMNYLNDAYYMFVRLTGGVADGSSAITTLTATQSTPTTAIDDRVMRIRSATNVTDNNRKVDVINIQDVDDMITEGDYYNWRNINRIDTEGKVQYMIIGEEEGYVRWVNVPDATVTIQLVIERLPLIPITKLQQKLTDVREEHHYHLLKWMRHLAYRKQDADTFNLVKSDQERDDFLAYCELSRREKNVRKHKVRTTSYGGL